MKICDFYKILTFCNVKMWLLSNLVLLKLFLCKLGLYIQELVSFEVVPTSLTWCKTKLAINALIFLCLQSMYIIRVVEVSEIIEEINTKMSTMWLLEKKFLLVFNTVVSCLSCKSKISFFHSISIYEVF